MNENTCQSMEQYTFIPSITPSCSVDSFGLNKQRLGLCNRGLVRKWINLGGGDMPTHPWARFRIWVGAGLGLGLGLREGWVDTSPESWSDPRKSPTHHISTTLGILMFRARLRVLSICSGSDPEVPTNKNIWNAVRKI